MVKVSKPISKKAAGGPVPVGTGRLKLSDIPAIVKTFMPEFQQKIIVGSEEHWETIAELKEIIQKMPHTYQTDKIPAKDKIVQLHYFFRGSDWYIVEKDMEKEQLQAYGYTILNGDTQLAEWGYISIEEIKQAERIELDFYFTPIKFGELRKKWDGEDDEDEDEEMQGDDEDSPEPVFQYGQHFGVPSGYGPELVEALLEKGFEVKVVSPTIIYLTKGGEYFYVNDNGGEFNLGDADSKAHIGNILYQGSAHGHWIAPVHVMASEIEEKADEFYKYVPGGEAKQAHQFKVNDPVKILDLINGTTYGIVKKVYGVDEYEIDAFSLEARAKYSTHVTAGSPDTTLQPMTSLEYIAKWKEFKALVPDPAGQQREDNANREDGEQDLKDEYDKKRQSLDEFFTPKWVAEIMLKLAKKYGFTGGNCLEPSFGHGVFFDVLTEAGIPQESLYGFEIFKDNIAVVTKKYPKANLVGHNFEYEFANEYKALNRDGIYQTERFKDATIDLVIGNPPYGVHKSPYSYLWNAELQVRIEGFFIYLALQKVKPGGLVVFIINSLWLYNGEKYNRQKERINELGDLIDAYRLPSGTFKGENRDTSIATDIVVFRKR